MEKYQSMHTNCLKMLVFWNDLEDILRSVNNFARAVTKWSLACDRRLARLTTYIHHTSDFRQYCHVGNTAQHCLLRLFQDSDFAGDLEDSNSTSGENSYVSLEAEHLSQSVSWICKKQTSVSHSSTESEIISLDAGLRMDGLPALDLWDIVIEVLRSAKQHSKTLCGTGDHSINENKIKTSTEKKRKREVQVSHSNTHGKGSRCATRNTTPVRIYFRANGLHTLYQLRVLLSSTSSTLTEQGISEHISVRTCTPGFKYCSVRPNT